MPAAAAPHASLRFQGLVPPPREVPRVLEYALFANRDVGWGLAFFVASTGLLVIASAAPDYASDIRFALVICATVLLVLGLASALPAIARMRRMLRLMRDGALAPGRIVGCRFEWDRKRPNVPYGEFLSTWNVQLTKSQMRKMWGCVTTLVIVFFVAPLALWAIAVVIALAVSALYEAMPDSETVRTAILSLAGVAAMAAVVVGAFRFIGRHGIDKATAPLMQLDLMMQDTEDDYVALAVRLLETARGTAPPPSLDEPLPEDSGGVALLCSVQYGYRGELHEGEGRVLFSDRLEPSGIEPLLVDPARPGEVLLLAGLPEVVTVNRARMWASTGSTWAETRLALTALFGAAAIVGVVRYFMQTW